MALTEFYPGFFEVLGIKVYWLLIVSYVFYGIFGALMALLWYIGSAYFCEDADIAEYQSIHLTLTGVRGMVAPLLGVMFYDLIGFSGVFTAGIILLTGACFLLYYSLKHNVMQNFSQK
jgi:hypothetical protein